MKETFDKPVGVTFGDCQENIKNLQPADMLDLIPEPTNEYDKNAVRVECAGKKIGYLKRGGWLQDMIIREHVRPKAEVYEVIGGGEGRSYGVVMKILY